MLLFSLVALFTSLPSAGEVILLNAPTAHPAPRAVSALDDKDDLVKKFAARIKKYGDRSNAGHFTILARIGTKSAFKALKKSVTSLREERAISAAYAAFAEFKGIEDLEEDAIEYLVGAALGNRRRESAPTAAATLGAFGAAAVSAAEEVAAESGNPEVRWAAVKPLLSLLGKRGNATALTTILECARPALDDEIKEVEQALKGFRTLPHRKLMIAALSDRDTALNLRLILMDRFASDPSDLASEAYLDCLILRSPKVQRKAVEVLAARPDSEKARVRLWSFLDADDPQLKLVAIEGLGKLSATDEKWQSRLRILMRDSDPLSRRGAARALVFQPQADAAEALLGMLEDRDWRVRLEVIRQLGAVRASASVEPLLTRMPLETGRLRRAIAVALRDLTGEDHGYSPDRWGSWWNGEGGPDYVLPSREEAAAKIAKLDASRASRDSVATFYSLPVYSDRVAFVVDTSGSMNAPTFLESEEKGSGRGGQVTAMDYARRELKTLIQRMPDGARCNLIFFHEDLDPWKRGLTELTERSRKKVIKFIENMEAEGGTALYDGLIEAFEDPEVDTIYILSDGAPSTGDLVDPEEIRAAIAELNATREVEIHGVDLSQASLMGRFARIVPLVRWLAEDSGGRYVAPGADEEAPVPGRRRGR